MKINHSEKEIQFLEKRLLFWEDKLQNTTSDKKYEEIQLRISNIESAINELNSSSQMSHYVLTLRAHAVFKQLEKKGLL